MPGSPDLGALRREAAGRYRSGDGRFVVEQASGRWLVLDAEQLDDLGLPLTRGPFATLDAAREAIADARVAPAPSSDLAMRRRALPHAPGAAGRRSGRGVSGPGLRRPPQAARPAEIRTYRAGDGARLRAFWQTVELRSLGDDDSSLDRLAERNPGLVLVAEAGDRIVGTALGAWDGRRGWIYHVGVAMDVRRTGLGRRMINEVERRLRALGCPKVNVVVTDDNVEGQRFWEALGYTMLAARQFGREL
jgi:ribosomal protein S18 acetylase RimI-like enzyme